MHIRVFTSVDVSVPFTFMFLKTDKEMPGWAIKSQEVLVLFAVSAPQLLTALGLSTPPPMTTV